MPLIFASALSTLALTLMDVALMIVAFEGYRKKSFLAVGAVFVIHLGVALSVLFFPGLFDLRESISALIDSIVFAVVVCFLGAGEPKHERLCDCDPVAFRRCSCRDWCCGDDDHALEKLRCIQLERSFLSKSRIVRLSRGAVQSIVFFSFCIFFSLFSLPPSHLVGANQSKMPSLGHNANKQ